MKKSDFFLKNPLTDEKGKSRIQVIGEEITGRKGFLIMKYEVIDLNSGRMMGKYLTREMAQDHANFIIRNGGRAEVREIVRK